MAKIYSPTNTHLDLAINALNSNQAIAVPTETVYGLAANATSDEAISAIYKIKGRPSYNPLIIHIKSAGEATKYAYLNENAKKLMVHFWPGPLTLILPRKENTGLSVKATANLETIALRCPAHPVMHKLLSRISYPLAAPSANLSGTISPTTAQHVHQGLAEQIDIILAGGKTKIGLESTILDLSTDHPKILRPGSVSQQDIEDIIGAIDVKEDSSAIIKAPGMLKSHYAPNLPIRLNAQFPIEGEAFLAFGPLLKEYGDRCLNLSPDNDLDEAAQNLFDMMHQLDDLKYTGIAIMPIPEIGIGIAINDRLKRAAAKKE